jgi:EmrB/QacA subfamily drug resistance transporter
LTRSLSLVDEPLGGDRELLSIYSEGISFMAALEHHNTYVGDGGAPVGRKGDHRRPILVALLVTLALAAIDSTVVTTAVPSIVKDLGGFTIFPWIFSIYLLTQSVSVPVYGRIADLYGRRPILYTGIAIFLLSSVFCGVAPNMPLLIAARALQGLGAGAIVPIVQTVIGDLYSVRERSRVQGYTASVWGVASILGPIVGGAITQYISWRWIFFINLPFGVVAITLLSRRLHETVERKEHKIDFTGAIIMSIGLSALIFGLLQGGTGWSWSSPREIGVLLASVVALGLFAWVEHRAPEPMIPSWVINRRPMLAANVANLVLGAVQFGLTAYVPAWAEGVRGVSPLDAGLTVATLLFGWPISSALAGRLYLNIGFRSTTLIGVIICLAGTALYPLLGPHSSVFLAASFGLLVGFGLGFIATPLLVSSQTIVGKGRRGVATASNLFARAVGSAVGIAVIGSLANRSLVAWISNPPRNLVGNLPTSVNSAVNLLENNAHLAPQMKTFIGLGLFHATHTAFLAVVASAILTLCALLAMPKKSEPLHFDDEGDEELIRPAEHKHIFEAPGS